MNGSSQITKKHFFSIKIYEEKKIKKKMKRTHNTGGLDRALK